MLAQLAAAWGNDAWTPHVEFLQSVLENAAGASGPILECGAGISTLILGVVCQVRGLRVTTLEEDPEWAKAVRDCLSRHGIESVSVIHAPLQSYDEYEWYSLPSEALPERISLAVCDGPSGRAPGARYGLVPLCLPRLGSGAVVLLDDAERPSEREFIPRWSALLGASPERVRPGR
ncbi:MAG TPA: hypothetical protein VFS09_12925, partial [Candidatus Eisenbacteria bacterium]|nr:hypothetical protein [Candidatus Eisenbacteria bacterium]